MAAYRWKSFFDDEDRPEKPRSYGVTEMRSPHYSLFSRPLLQDIFESMGQFVDGLKFSGGSHSMMPKTYIRDEYKQLGFDTIELDVTSLDIPEETLLRYVRLIKSDGLRVKPQFSVKFNKSDVPLSSNRAFGAYVVPTPRSSDYVEDVDLLVRRAERCLEAGADMIMIDADDLCRHADSVRGDLIAKIIGRLGLEKTMFEASSPQTSEWFVKQYGPKVNLFVDHSQVMDLECLRGQNLGKNHTSILGSSYYLF
nr:protein HEAT-STRESS-ASSOCIATED 32 [Ipomoea batatas]GMD93017.1 protein HEAT-STRESS-ASSOCIATED 32 [Ipomoea batatas]